MGLALLLGLFALGVLIGLPVAFCLGVAAVITVAYEGLPLVIAVQRLVSGISMFSLLAIPFFIFAGELMFHGGIAGHLVRFASSLVGRVRGGLGVVNVFSSMLFVESLLFLLLLKTTEAFMNLLFTLQLLGFFGKARVSHVAKFFRDCLFLHCFFSLLIQLTFG